MDPLEIAVALARIETKLDAAIAAKDDHEGRIRSLEKLVWRAAGAATVLGAGFGAGFGRIFS